MRTHIDWLTFTMAMQYSEGNGDNYAGAIERAFLYTFSADVVSSVFGGAWAKKERSRAPYTDAWHDIAGGISLYASPNLTHCTVEISGQGCERLIERGEIENILLRCKERVTRIDIASDVETSTQPAEFVSIVKHERMRFSGYQKSETGETCYVGSQKSERYARVYRYYEPHPRSHLLRVEHVFRRDYAKSVAQAIVAHGLEETAAAAGEAFGWAHAEWDITRQNDVNIGIVAPEKGGGKTVWWLVHSVAPAIKRLIADGTIRDYDAFFKAYFTPDSE